MGYKLIVTQSANQDLDEILTYLVRDLAAPKAALDFVTELEARYTALADNPLIYELSRNERLLRKGYRRFIIGNYVVPYTVSEDRREVIIARIIYGKRDFEKWL